MLIFQPLSNSPFFCGSNTSCLYMPIPLLYLFIFFLIIVKLVLFLIMHNAFAPGREAANQQSIENLTTTPQPNMTIICLWYFEIYRILNRFVEYYLQIVTFNSQEKHCYFTKSGCGIGIELQLATQTLFVSSR